MTDRRKSLIREYKERAIPAGIFQIQNTANGKVFLGSSLNLEGSLNRHKFQLSAGMHPNRALQEDWAKFGPDMFRFEIVEEVKRTKDPDFNMEDELTLLEQIWLEKLNPTGENCYNSRGKVRQV